MGLVRGLGLPLASCPHPIYLLLMSGFLFLSFQNASPFVFVIPNLQPFLLARPEAINGEDIISKEISSINLFVHFTTLNKQTSNNKE